MAEYDDNSWVLFAHICKAQRNLAETEFNKLGLHVGQEHVLLCLMEQESMGQSELVDTLCIEPPTVTKMLQRMEKNGLIERRQDEQDGRASRVNATEQGKALQQPILQIWKKMEARMVANMTMAEQTLLRRLLMQALANLNDIEDEE